jgi:iron complex transport system ATP-binding protein
MIQFKKVTFAYPEEKINIFINLSLTLPDGIVSLIGQNATGKSTMLLLAGGRLLPTQGKVILAGRDTKSFKNEKQRDSFCAFIYQNMEFETQENIGTLLEYVYAHGYHTEKKKDFITELREIFELNRILNKRTQEISKGELQRVILAFSLLYGTPTIMMDEPIFAMEEYQKHKALEYICAYARQEKINICYSLHELDLTKKYSDYLVLFYKDAPPLVGPTEELFQEEKIEKAYEVPFIMLRNKESLFRDFLIQIGKKSSKTNKNN